MIGRLWLLACGQVRVRVTGASLTRFLNLCAAQGITLRQMDRTAWNELHATLSIRDFRTLRRHMGRTGCRVHILRKRGLPFLAARLRPRTALWGGAVFAAALCWLLGTHVWAIQTEIAPAIDETAVMQQLSEMGVRIGMPIKKLNTRQIRWKMMQLQPNITFFSLNLRGNSLTVVAYGSTDPPEVLDEHAITKVVAARDGVVTQVRALEGQPMVRAGDAVQTGDTLISGLVEPTREGGKYRTAHARGTVQAHTVHTVRAARPLTEQSKRYTGKIRHQYALVMGNKRLNFYIGSGIAGGTCAACGAGHTNVYILRAGADDAHRRGRAGGYALARTGRDRRGYRRHGDEPQRNAHRAERRGCTVPYGPRRGADRHRGRG